MDTRPLKLVLLTLLILIGRSPAQTIDYTQQLKNKPFLSVQDAPYKATGNGITDDTAAWQAALNAASTYGKAVFCPSGTYLISTPITLLNGATIFSDGQCNFLIATGFSSGNTQNCVFCNYTGVDGGTFTVTGYNDFGFYNLNFSSQSITGQTQYTTPIELLGTPGTKVERVRLIGITSANVLGGGIYVREANHVLVDGANIYGYRSTHASWGAGITFQGVQDSTISNSFIHNTNAAGWHAILVDDWTRAPKNIRIIGNDIHDIQENGDTNGSDGITLELNTASLYGSGIEIIGNTITNIPDGNAIYLAGQNIVTNNRIDNVVRGMLSLPGSGTVMNLEISHNIITNTTSSTYGGLFLTGAPSGSDNVSVEGNMIQTSAAQGITVTGVLNSTIKNNIVQATQEEGIYTATVTGVIDVENNHVSDSGLGGSAGQGINCTSATIHITCAYNVVDFPAAGTKPIYGLQYTDGISNIIKGNTVASGATAAYQPNVIQPFMTIDGPEVTFSQANTACANISKAIGWIRVSDANTSTRGATLSSGGGSTHVIAICGPNATLTIN